MGDGLVVVNVQFESSSNEMAEGIYELASEAGDELVGVRRPVWRGWDFESELRPRLDKLTELVLD